MNARMLIPSKYFSAADFEGDLTVTIDRANFVDLEVEGKNGKPATTETRGSLTLKESGKPWVSNVTNTKCLIAMFGEETDRWHGKRVTVFAERVMSFGEWVLGVRIRGSPDIAQPVSVRIKLRKKREQVLTMAVTGAPKPNGSNGHAKARPSPPKVVTFGKEQGWKDTPIASLSADKADEIIKFGEAAILGEPKAPWVNGVAVCLDAIKAELTRRLAPPPNEPPPPTDEDAPF